jgi:hypothetical protein
MMYDRKTIDKEQQPDQRAALEALELLLAFTGIRVAADRLKVIELARRLSSGASRGDQPVKH